MTVRPASVDFWLYLGASFNEPVTLKDANGAPVDLTGYSAKLHMRRDISDAAPVLSFTSTDGTIVLGGAAGTVTLVRKPADYAAVIVDWDGEAWVHDLLLSNDGVNPAIVERTYQGSVYVLPGVTRP